MKAIRLTTSAANTARTAGRAFFPSLLNSARRCYATSSASNSSDVTSTDRECFVELLTGNDKGIGVITMNRPAAKNAFGRTMLSQFRESVQALRFNNDVRVVILKSAVDGVFSAGADLKERATMSKQETAEFVYNLRKAFTEIEDLPIPTIAAIEGACLGGGLELALGCDMRVAAKSTAILGLPETSLAIIPGAGGTQRLPRLIGVARAKELIFTAKRIDADEAERIGLVNYAVEPGQTVNKSLEIARQIIPRGPVAVKMAKIAISQGVEVDKASGLILEQQCYAQVIPTKDRLEGLQAFKEKRQPNYTGE
eukprot:GEZU01001295.1.p1 GENE.GEZU01001295.1~~GEZU01001295.1.p1  ORF type:complete len:311 (+),score=96.92 GEZU01001295.1:76-1008(+)